MTDNISRMYELAGIEKRFKAYTEDGIVKYFHTLDEIIKSNIYYRPDMYCCDLDDDAKELPPFTETKQLELIKWIGNITTLAIASPDCPLSPIGYSGNYVLIPNKLNFEPFSTIHKDFPQALAGLVCELWEDLTPEQREEVRGILE